MPTIDIKKAVSKKRDKIPSTYSLGFYEMTDLYHMSKEDIFEALLTAYELGFIRGTRARDRKKVPVL